MVEINIKQLAEQLDAAQAILDQIRITSGCEVFPNVPIEPASRSELALAMAIKAQHAREVRPEFMGGEDLFGEPAWDILVGLFIRQTRDEKVSVAAPSLGSKQVATTTFRWFLVMEDHGLILFEAHPGDAQQVLVRLTPTGYEAMLRYFDAIAG